jgi:hypothetical protein
MKETNEKYWELSEEEKQLLETTCGTIPDREALYWILPELRMAIRCFNQGTLNKSEILPGMITYINEQYEREIPGKVNKLTFSCT